MGFVFFGRFVLLVHLLPYLKRNRRTKNGPIKAKGVELAIFATRINTFRELEQEIVIQLTANKGLPELLVVSRHNDGSKPKIDKLLEQGTRIALPTLNFT